MKKKPGRHCSLHGTGFYILYCYILLLSLSLALLHSVNRINIKIEALCKRKRDKNIASGGSHPESTKMEAKITKNTKQLKIIKKITVSNNCNRNSLSSELRSENIASGGIHPESTKMEAKITKNTKQLKIIKKITVSNNCNRNSLSSEF